ncbi:SDR family oxidoreductase [Candidatus Enterococcus ferrettii]|uniref:Sorbitol-6-phosphate 2-dehydrogenase n=1 Tax=Candidatus Enterococcus ferrettii TaxID=2815324 RepID=A0ABV0EKE8_9ENTE|nr:SDR family oxidoreductase [Enterococcus sp. 665A]MBO1341617.1 SDR family oxidoreductase [Enterococcus sp. 665A]
MSDWLGLQGKVYIVTGGSSGIGKAIVDELLAAGAQVINADIHSSVQLHPRLHFIETDVSSKTAVEHLIATTLKKAGTIDGIVNNAGINLPRLLADQKHPHGRYELTEEIFDQLLAINLKSVYLLSQAAARIFYQTGTGVVINISSEAGLEGSEGQSIYAATKAAINSFTRSWAKELGKFNIRVVGVAPGIMEETGLRTLEYEEALAYTRGITVDALRKNYSKVSTIPLGRSGRLEEVANVVSFLLSDRASYISGVTMNVAGGKTRG